MVVSSLAVQYSIAMQVLPQTLPLQSLLQFERLYLDWIGTVNGASVVFTDNPRSTYDVTNAPTIARSGIAGGVIPVRIASDSAFTDEQVAVAIVRALNEATSVTNAIPFNTSLLARVRGGSTIFLENATSVSSNIDSFFLQGIQDTAGNFLRPNRINDETQSYDPDAWNRS